MIKPYKPERIPLSENKYERASQRVGYDGGWNDCWEEWIDALEAYAILKKGYISGEERFVEGYKQAMLDLIEWIKEDNND